MPVLVDSSLLVPCTGSVPLATIPNGAVVWRGNTLEWVGAEPLLPEQFRNEARISARGGLILPGLIDCHTHLLFGGWREGDFLRRLGGGRYADSHSGSGGIYETVNKTALESDDALLNRAACFAREMGKVGVTTIEAKSGYGLDLVAERRLLRLYAALRPLIRQELHVTFLAHVVPTSRSGERRAYVDELVDFVQEISALGLASACDVFVESVAFTVAEGARILTAARAACLARKVHADQLADGGGALLAAEMGAVSADHLEYVSEEGISAMATAGVTAVLLPFASWYLKAPYADGRRLADASVTVAVATDFNPGSAPSYHLPLALTFACLNNGLLPDEALLGASRCAASALGIGGITGTLEPGKRADVIVVDATSVAQWLYHVRPEVIRTVIMGGEIVHQG